MGRMAQLELGRLLRVKAMIDASVDESNPGDSVHASAEAYVRLHAEISGMVDDTELHDEFDRLFPDEVLPLDHAEELGMSLSPQGAVRAGSEGRRAQTHLRQLAGWVQGLIEEQLLERRIVAEAEANAKEQAKQVGFTLS
jgi:hypothetical protein